MISERHVTFPENRNPMRRHLPERWKPVAATAVTAALFIPLLILGGPAFARTGAAASQYQYSSSSQYQYKITICHLTRSRKHPGHTISIAAAAWKAHWRHGDHLGPCTGTEIRRPKHHGHGGSDAAQGQDTSGDHGKSGEHANNGEHGNGNHGKHGGDD